MGEKDFKAWNLKKKKKICKFPGDRKVWYPYHENGMREEENIDLGIIIY